MSDRPTTDDLTDNAIAFRGVPWQDVTPDSSTEHAIIVPFAGLPIMMIGSPPPPAPGGRRRQAMVGAF